MLRPMKRKLLSTFVVLFALCGCKAATENGTFKIVQGERDGHPLFAMIDSSSHDNKFKTRFPWFLSISIPLTNPTKDGLTTDSEASALNDWEDSLEKEFAGACRFAYVGRVTWNGTRELLYYVDTPDCVVSKLRKFANDHPARDFNTRCERDERWGKVSVYLGTGQ